MVGMVIVIVVCVLVVLAVVAGAAWWAKRSFDTAVDRVTERQVADRDAVLTAALQQVDVLNRSQMDAATRQVQAEVAARHQVIDSSLDEVRSEIRIDLERLGELVAKMGETSAQRFGQVDASLRSHAEVAARLNDSTASLREALSNPQARGQWGERMAEDVLRLAGFTEHVNYHKQAPIAAGVAGGGGGRPDFTFDLPKGHVLYMDVKFPMASYLRHLEADTDEARAQHLRAFLRDVRDRVKELAKREYERGSTKPSVDYVLLFLPNEQLTGFIHQHDPALLDDALGQRVVMCSPLTLFAFLGVIRQAFDNFMVEQTSNEMLALVGAFNQQWRRYVASTEKVGRHLAGLQAEFDHLMTTRERQLERPLRQLEALRQQRAIPVDPEFTGELPDEPPIAPALRVIDRGSLTADG